MSDLFVIAGHGNGDPGACGNGYQEAERVRVLARRVKELGGDIVILGDLNRNYYADKGISSLTIPKTCKILELHMDSASSSARGGHVVIKSGFEADTYDTALADMISGIFPGRSQKIVARADLANVNRAASRGYNYRLMECGFISNSGDVKTFNTRLDEIAKGILKSFGIGVSTSTPTPSTPQITPNHKPTVSSMKDIKVDGDWGPDTTRLAQKVFGTPIDGVVSNQYYCYKSKNPGLSGGWDWDASPSQNGSVLIKAIQRWVGVKADGFIGPSTIKAIQKKLGCKVCDGFFSKGSFAIKKFQTYLNSKN